MRTWRAWRAWQVGVVIATVVCLSGCGMLGLGGEGEGSANPVEPTSPSGAAYLGTWRSTSTGSASLDGCSQFDWQATGVQGSTVFGSFTATCAGFQLVGNGTGTPNGSGLDWSALGTATKASVTCPYTLTGPATTKGTQTIEVVFSGTVCGISVSGTEELVRN